MIRRSFVGLLLLALACTVAMGSQVKEMPKKTVRIIPKTTTLDINSAPETDLVALGIDRAVAKKIIDGRPYRNKRELVSRQLLTAEQYNKLKDQIVAKQPGKK